MPEILIVLRKWSGGIAIVAGGLLAGPVRAQQPPPFDSAYGAAEAVPDAGARLGRLRKLLELAYQGTPSQTIAYGKGLLRAATEVGSDTDRYQAHFVLCTGYERSRDYGQAIDHGLQAVGIARQRRDAVRETRMLETLAFTYGSLGLMSGDSVDKAQALRYAREALEVVRKKNVRDEAGYALTAAADVHAMFAQYDTAVALYGRALAAFRAGGKTLPWAVAMNLGNTLHYKNDFEGALAAYRMADSLSVIQGGGAFYALKIASNRAILYDDLGQPDKSRQETQRVLGEARAMGATDIEVDMLAHLRKLCQKEGRFAEALTAADSLAAVKDRMLNAERTGQVAELQARYDAGVKDQQIAGQQAVIRRNRQQNIAQWSGIALLLGAGGAAPAGLRRSRRLNRENGRNQQALVAQKAELERVNAMKDRLFGLVSHDVRVPLHALSAYAMLLDEDGDLPPERVRAYNADLRQILGDTTLLMENLLQFARTQMQAPRPRPVRFPVSAVLDRVQRLLQPAMDQKGLRLQLEGDGQRPVVADEDMTELILRNLLSNAIKFSGTGGTIAVAVVPEASGVVRVTVRDWGVGMTPELTARWNDGVASALAQSGAGTQHETGAGLGMVLCKTFAGVMGGTLHAASTEGVGSTFMLQLPAADPAR